jgi:hypothetical protein
MARKPLSTKIENDLQKEIKKLAIDLERPFNGLLEEAIRDLLKKYRKEMSKPASYSLISPLSSFLKPPAAIPMHLHLQHNSIPIERRRYGAHQILHGAP